MADHKGEGPPVVCSMCGTTETGAYIRRVTWMLCGQCDDKMREEYSPGEDVQTRCFDQGFERGKSEALAALDGAEQWWAVSVKGFGVDPDTLCETEEQARDLVSDPKLDTVVPVTVVPGEASDA